MVTRNVVLTETQDQLVQALVARIFMSRSLRLTRRTAACLVEIAQVDDSKIRSQAGRRL